MDKREVYFYILKMRASESYCSGHFLRLAPENVPYAIKRYRV